MACMHEITGHIPPILQLLGVSGDRSVHFRPAGKKNTIGNDDDPGRGITGDSWHGSARVATQYHRILPGLACNESVFRCRLRLGWYRGGIVIGSAVIRLASVSVPETDVDVIGDPVEGSFVPMGDELDNPAASSKRSILVGIDDAAFRFGDTGYTCRYRHKSEDGVELQFRALDRPPLNALREFTRSRGTTTGQ